VTVLHSKSKYSHEPTLLAGVFPGGRSVIWRDWYTHRVVVPTAGGPTRLQAPLGHINVHIRDKTVLLLHSKPAYTIAETREGPFSLLLSLGKDGSAFGSAYLDDGESFPPGPATRLQFLVPVGGGKLRVTPRGTFGIDQLLEKVVILGVPAKPKSVTVNGKKVIADSWKWIAETNEVTVQNIGGNLNRPLDIIWG